MNPGDVASTERTAPTMRKWCSLDDMIRYAYEETIKQGHASVDHRRGYVVCLYRGPYGRKCPVGFLISDDLASRLASGQTANDLTEDDIASFYSGPTRWREVRAELRKLQRCHDIAAFDMHFVTEFRRHALATFPWLA